MSLTIYQVHHPSYLLAVALPSTKSGTPPIGPNFFGLFALEMGFFGVVQLQWYKYLQECKYFKNSVRVMLSRMMPFGNASGPVLRALRKRYRARKPSAAVQRNETVFT